MANSFSTIAELEASINLRMELALRNTMQILLQKLKEIILEEVYSYPSPNGAWDNRTGQFLDSWIAQEPYFIDGWYQEISQDGFDFLYNGNSGMWSHGSPYSNTGGALSAQALDDIINDGLSDSNFNFPAIDARPFFDMWKIYVTTSIESIFKTECVKAKLPVTSSITATFT